MIGARRLAPRLSAVAAVGLTGICAWAAEPASRPAPRPLPAYTSVRWNENYSYLSDPANRSDGLDRLKYLPLGGDPDTYLSLGASARYRYELFNNNNFGAGPQDDTGYHLTRLLAHADLHLTRALRGFVQLKSAMEDGRAGGPRPSDADEFDLQQAFVDVRMTLPDSGRGDDAASLTYRFGRQELSYGAQRLIGPLEWGNVRRAWDGAKITLDVPGLWTFELLWARPVIVEKEEPSVADGDANLAGVYGVVPLPSLFGKEAATKLEPYVLYLHRDNAPFVAEGVDDERRWTVGARLSGAPRPFDLDIELDYQFGDYGSGDISAWSVAAEGGYTFAAAPLSPRLLLGVDAASGDDDPGDDDLETFNQLYPTGHPFLGYIDAIGRQNIIDLHTGVEVELLKAARHAKRVTLRGDYHLFWRQSDTDAVYNAGGAVLRVGSGSNATEVGSEADLLLNWQIDRHWSAYFGYSHFWPGDFIQDTGPAGDIDFLYAAVYFIF